MTDEDHARLINFFSCALNYDYGTKYKWFVSFGALLYFLRDKNMGKKLTSDYDISVVGDIPHDMFITNMASYGFKVVNKIIDDKTGRPYQVVFANEIHGLGAWQIDVFFWVKAGNYWWHGLDHRMEHPKNGIPTEYCFKATPKDLFSGEVRKYMWYEIIPQVNFPDKYGSLLDLWYPGWYVPDRNFGQSRCSKELRVKSCKNLIEKLSQC